MPGDTQVAQCECVNPTATPKQHAYLFSYLLLWIPGETVTANCNFEMVSSAFFFIDHVELAKLNPALLMAESHPPT